MAVTSEIQTVVFSVLPNPHTLFLCAKGRCKGRLSCGRKSVSGPSLPMPTFLGLTLPPPRWSVSRVTAFYAVKSSPFLWGEPCLPKCYLVSRLTHLLEHPHVPGPGAGPQLCTPHAVFPGRCSSCASSSGQLAACRATSGSSVVWAASLRVIQKTKAAQTTTWKTGVASKTCWVADIWGSRVQCSFTRILM